jgi:hypothetical protein
MSMASASEASESQKFCERRRRLQNRSSRLEAMKDFQERLAWWAHTAPSRARTPIKGNGRDFSARESGLATRANAHSETAAEAVIHRLLAAPHWTAGFQPAHASAHSYARMSAQDARGPEELEKSGTGAFRCAQAGAALPAKTITLLLLQHAERLELGDVVGRAAGIAQHPLRIIFCAATPAPGLLPLV